MRRSRMSDDWGCRRYQMIKSEDWGYRKCQKMNQKMMGRLDEKNG
jgi:hypothetical protein